ncbi:pyridoxal-phosphate dependent enzyme [Oligoflexus tunisiensis]|uniref:pyridoxal-phosphate dependent enzyme n=1 Tax=Oligoflexus tunisiensis TaxID=708132 RepID=UPI00159EFFFE|nr:pyridoxal-phosphate dependent enzyme [Oligoflexus tunisiensis]
MRETWQERLARQLEHSVLRGGRCGFWLTSRMHPLKGWSVPVWLKRDDELGPYGSKWRKMQGLAWAIQEEGADTILAWGGSRSQHLLGLLALGRELGLDVRLLVKEGSPRQAQGPDLLWPLLTTPDTVTMISRAEWPQVEHRAQKEQAALTAAGKKVFLVREGGAQVEALWGALTLPLDIVAQEKVLGFSFTRIWVDAGTGLTAQALILGLGLLQHRAQVEVLLCAGDAGTFARDLERRRGELSVALQTEIPLAAWRCHVPGTARSFGSTNQAVFLEIARTAREHGVLLDPIYSAKLLMKVREAQPEWAPEDRVLILHSGGMLSLFGFPAELQALTF